MRKAILYFIAVIILISAACNFPTRSLATLTIQSNTPKPTANEPTQAPTTHNTPTADATPINDLENYVVYTTQSGDTLNAVAARFGVEPAEIRSMQAIPAQGLIPFKQILMIPRLPEIWAYSQPLLPDVEIVNSPCGKKVDIQAVVDNGNGKLNSYSQIVDSQTLSGAEIVKRVSEETSVNPHFLLAFIEFRSHWVTAQAGTQDPPYPLSLNVPGYEGLYLELSLSAKLLNLGYYGWRQGTMTSLTFPDGGSVRITPELNTGSAGLQYLFARLYKQVSWEDALYGPDGFLATYQHLFGDPDACARSLGPLFPDDLQVPTLELPFAPGEAWALTGGLHNDWNTGTPLGALDFAPITGEAHCVVSRAWVLASASGVVTRSSTGLVQVDLADGEGSPTGWELLYLHVATIDRVPAGMVVQTGDRIGHPSCEGGNATGTHVHLARLYRGEWIGAGDPFPLVLSGWLALPGTLPYQSALVKGDQIVAAHPDASGNSIIIR